jgi:hypothetical protein
MRKRLLPTLVPFVLVVSTLFGCNGASSTASLTIFFLYRGRGICNEGMCEQLDRGRVGMCLEEGYIIKTGEDSSGEITFSDGSTVELQPDTEIEVGSLDVLGWCPSLLGQNRIRYDGTFQRGGEPVSNR